MVTRLVVVAALIASAISCKKAPPPPAPVPAAAAVVPGTAAAVPGTVAPGAPAAPAAAKPMPAQIPAVVARVNGETIERWEFENAVKRVEARAGGSVPPERRDEVLRDVLDQLVAYHLLAQESRLRKMEVSDKDVEARLAEIRQNFPNEEAFKQGLAAQGLSPEQLRTQTRTGLEVAKVVDAEVTSKVAVEDAAVNAFYQQNLERFKQGDSVHASHILIGVAQDATPAQKADAKAKAQAALKQVRGGADFSIVAKAQSQDPGSAQNGGDLGFFPKGQMNPQFEDAAFKLKVGAVSAVVETPFGFHIIKVHERRGPRTAPFTEVSGQIKEFLLKGQREEKLNQLVEQAKAKGKIQILV
jgi:peptidyl-prolyl cis-trans isomerase C